VEITMEFRSKLLVALTAAASLFAGAARASEPGNITLQFPNGTACGGLTINGSGPQLSYPINLGQATVSGSNFFFMPITMGRVRTALVGSAGAVQVYDPPIIYQATFNMTQSTYQLIVPNIPSLNFDRVGTFTGSIASNGFGGFNINLSLDCGVTITGVTVFAGS
jgi:hypothetical protein